MNAFEYAPAYAQGSTPRRGKMSREAAVAIGVSVAVHIAVVGYVATQNFDTFKQAFDDTPVLTTLERLPRKEPKPPPSRPRDPPKPTMKIHDPPNTPPLTPPVDPLEAEAVKNIQADPGPLAIPLTKDPPIQIAEAHQAEPPKAKVIRNPSWARRPTGAELGVLYPRRAAEMGISGGATILCEVIANGSVRNCAVVDESPKGKGFGEAAMASAKLYRLNPRTVDGETVEGAKVRIPLVFNLAD